MARYEYTEAHEPEIHELLCDPATPGWLRRALYETLAVDPVDAANAAERMAMALDRRALRAAGVFCNACGHGNDLHRAGSCRWTVDGEWCDCRATETEQA